MAFRNCCTVGLNKQ